MSRAKPIRNFRISTSCWRQHERSKTVAVGVEWGRWPRRIETPAWPRALVPLLESLQRLRAADRYLVLVRHQAGLDAPSARRDVRAETLDVRLAELAQRAHLGVHLRLRECGQDEQRRDH